MVARAELTDSDCRVGGSTINGGRELGYIMAGDEQVMHDTIQMKFMASTVDAWCQCCCECTESDLDFCLLYENLATHPLSAADGQ